MNELPGETPGGMTPKEPQSDLGRMTFSAYNSALDVQYRRIMAISQVLDKLKQDERDNRGRLLEQAINSWIEQEVAKVPIVGDETTFPTIVNANDAIPNDMVFLAEANFIGRFTSYGSGDRLEVRKGKWIKTVDGQPETREATLGRRFEVDSSGKRIRGSCILQITDEKTGLRILYYGREFGDIDHVSRNGYDLSLSYKSKNGRSVKQLYHVQDGRTDVFVDGESSNIAIEEGSPDLFTEADKLVNFLNGAKLEEHVS